jgi:hypothetical protein
MAKKFEEYHKINEEGVAAANAATSGMGSVTTATPASVPGAAITGDGTAGSGDIGMAYGVFHKAPAYNNRKKKGKKEKEPKKHKLSDMIKFEDFDMTKYILENFDLKSVDSKEFEKMMKDIEKSLSSTSKKKAKDWKDELQRDLFDKLDVKNWKDAYEKDPSACIAYKSRLDDYFNKPEESLEEEKEEKEDKKKK